MEELNLEASQYEVGVSGGVEHEALRNSIVQTDAPNAFNSILHNPMLEKVTACTPELTGPVVAK